MSAGCLTIGFTSIPLLLFELFQFVCCVLIFGIEFERFAIVGDGLLFLAVLGVGFGQAVIDVARLGIFLDIEIENGDGVGIPAAFKELVAELIEGTFVEIITIGIGALEFAVLTDGSIDATIHHSLAEVRDERAFRRGWLLAIEDGANAIGHFTQVRTGGVVEDDDEVVIADQALFEGVEAVDAAAVGDHGLSGTRLIGRDGANVPAVSVVFQIRTEELLLKIARNKFVAVESLVPLIKIFDRGIEGTGGIRQRHV